MIYKFGCYSLAAFIGTILSREQLFTGSLIESLLVDRRTCHGITTIHITKPKNKSQLRCKLV